MPTDTPLHRDPALSAQNLSVAAQTVWAKSWPNPALDNQIEAWLPLFRHLADTAETAGMLWDRWLPPAITRSISSAVGSPASARSLVRWLAACHDVGKASPAFAVQVPRLCDAMSRQGLHSDATLAGSEDRREARHELVSHLAAREWLIDVHRFDAHQAEKIASVLAAHHGRPTNASAVLKAASRERLLGNAAWRDVRTELLEAATADTASPADIEQWRLAVLPQHVLVLLSAIVIVADWIASNDSLFPLARIGEDIRHATRARAATAWRELGMPAPWAAHAPDDDATLFATRFGLTEPRPVQSELMKLARECSEPGLMILEAEMGVGKTEAALAAAEILATRFGLGGIFVGLPTQATADGMFARVIDWAKHLDLDTPINVHLGHGKSAQNTRFERMRQDARFRSIGDRHENQTTRRAVTAAIEELVVAHQWFSDARRGPLSNLVVATIDQALMGALRSKHLMLRHLALAGKVVVFDEVHAYDAFTGQYLEGVLRWLGAYRAPVILLSATLPSDRRRTFVEAYRAGQGVIATAPNVRSAAARQRRREGILEPVTTNPLAVLDGDIGYPSIVSTGADGAIEVILPAQASSPRTVSIERIDDDLVTLSGILREALSDDGTAVVIRNTVGRVQETAAYLRAHLDIPVVVAHSRFLARDRAEKDRELLRLFGKDGSHRPKRMIVVASQVVEQSLDIDFDLMVSDLAPIDLLLQRAGRLHRHQRDGRPERVSTPRLLIAGAEWQATPPTPDRGSRKVYAPYVLLRSAAVLDGLTKIVIPDDIPRLVQAAYGGAPVGPTSWLPEIETARRAFAIEQESRRERAGVFLLPAERANDSLLGWVDGSAGDPATDSFARASVRDGEETIEVFVVQRDADGTLWTPRWMSEGGGRQIPDNERPNHALTRILLGCSLRLPAALGRGAGLDMLIRDLEEQHPAAAWHGSYELRGELVLVLDERQSANLRGFTVVYDRDDGLSLHREDTRHEAPQRSQESETLV